jgi:hypothetical protein
MIFSEIWLNNWPCGCRKTKPSRPDN